MTGRMREIPWEYRGLLSLYCFKFHESYGFKFHESGRATEITHISGTTCAIPPHVYIDRSFELERNWSDSEATVQLTPMKFRCIDLFTDGNLLPLKAQLVGPRPEAINSIAERAGAAYRRELEQASKGDLADKGGIFRESATKRRQAGAAKARAARTQVTVAKRKSRRVSLAPIVQA